MPDIPIPSPAPYAQQIGKGAGEPIANMLESLIKEGYPVPAIPVFISPPTATEKILDVVGTVGQVVTSPESMNTGVAFLSAQTAGKSAIGFLTTKDDGAKTFYALGFLFAGTATGVSSTAALSKSCKIDKVGILGEALGEACYRVAEEANRIALARDNKTTLLKNQYVN